MAGRRGAEEAENAGGSLQERGWFGRAMGPKGVWRGVWVNLEMMEIHMSKHYRMQPTGVSGAQCFLVWFLEHIR